MRIVAVLSLMFAALLSGPAVMAQAQSPAPDTAAGEARAGAAEAKSEKDKKEARKARREHRRMVNHRIRRKH